MLRRALNPIYKPYQDGARQDPDGGWWLMFRLPYHGLEVGPEHVHMLPTEQTRLLLLNGAEALLLDPCPADWMSRPMEELIALGARM